LLDKALQKKSMERERLRLAIIERVKQILKQMHGTIPFEKAYLFGTITKPYRFSEESDIDIAFIGLRDEDFFPALAYLSRNPGRDLDSFSSAVLSGNLSLVNFAQSPALRLPIYPSDGRHLRVGDTYLPC